MGKHVDAVLLTCRIVLLQASTVIVYAKVSSAAAAGNHKACDEHKTIWVAAAGSSIKSCDTASRKSTFNTISAAATQHTLQTKHLLLRLPFLVQQPAIIHLDLVMQLADCARQGGSWQQTLPMSSLYYDTPAFMTW
jgi:hypothetical protein